MWWEEKGRWNCVIVVKRKVGVIVWWEEKGRCELCGGKRKVGGIV